MNFIFFEDQSRDKLLPLTFTRPVGEIRVGILTIKEKWERHLSGPISYVTQKYLSKKFKLHIPNSIQSPIAQITNSETQLNIQIACFGHWNFEFIWSLVLVYWCFAIISA